MLYCIEQEKSLEELSLEKLKEFSPVIEKDFYEAISLKACVERRNTGGAPGSEAMKAQIKEARAFLKSLEKQNGGSAGTAAKQ